jgi:hypothetical protein
MDDNVKIVNISCGHLGFCIYRGEYHDGVALFLDGDDDGVDVEWSNGNDEWMGPKVLPTAKDLQKLVEDLFQNSELATEISSGFDNLRRGRYARVAQRLLWKRLVCRQDL